MKTYRVKQNGDSLQFYKEGSYLGSRSVKKLCQELEQEPQNGTAQPKTQVLAQKSIDEIADSGTNDQ